MARQQILLYQPRSKCASWALTVKIHIRSVKALKASSSQIAVEIYVSLSQ